MNNSPSRKKTNVYGLFNKIKIPKGGVNTSQRKKEMIEILEDWRFVKKRISVKDVTTLQERSLTKKIIQLIPEYQKYKKSKQETVHNITKNIKPIHEITKHPYKILIESKHDSSKSISSLKGIFENMGEDKKEETSVNKAVNRVESAKDVSNSNSTESMNMKFKRISLKEVADNRILKMKNEFKKIIKPSLIIEIKKEEEAVKPKEQIKRGENIPNFKTNFKKIFVTKIQQQKQTLFKLNQNLENKYEKYMRRFKLQCDNKQIRNNVSDYLVKINNFRPSNPYALEEIRNSSFKELERIEQSQSRNLNKNKSASLFFKTSLNDINKDPPSINKMNRTKSDFFKTEDIIKKTLKPTKSIGELYTKIKGFYKDSYKSKIKEDYLNNNKYKTRFNYVPSSSFITDLNSELMKTTSLLQENYSRQNNYLDKKKFYYRSMLKFENYKNDLVSKDLKIDLKAEIKNNRKQEDFFQFDSVLLKKINK